MPMEGQWDRVRTPLATRDRRLIAIVSLVAILAAAVALAVYLSRGGSRTRAGCLSVEIASTMGGTTLHPCGTAARRFCATNGRVSQDVVAQCRALGYALPPSSGVK
jgi:hypothetical protein